MMVVARVSGFEPVEYTEAGDKRAGPNAFRTGRQAVVRLTGHASNI